MVCPVSCLHYPGPILPQSLLSSYPYLARSQGYQPTLHRHPVTMWPPTLSPRPVQFWAQTQTARARAQTPWPRPTWTPRARSA